MNLNKLREICGDATPGPWKRSSFEEVVNGLNGVPLALDYHTLVEANERPEDQFCILENSEKDNVDFMATFNPETVAAMLDVIEAAHCLDEYAAWRNRACGYHGNLCDVCDAKQKLKSLLGEGE